MTLPGRDEIIISTLVPMKAMLVLLLVGMALIALNEALKPAESRVVYKYLSRDMDAWFRDPENQPSYMFKDTLFGDNVRA